MYGRRFGGHTLILSALLISELSLFSKPALYSFDMKIVEITSEPVELYKILKFEAMVGSGGEAKMVIAEGLVELNGEVETQKRKKIVSGDVIKFSDEVLLIRFVPNKV